MNGGANRSLTTIAESWSISLVRATMCALISTLCVQSRALSAQFRPNTEEIMTHKFLERVDDDVDDLLGKFGLLLRPLLRVVAKRAEQVCPPASGLDGGGKEDGRHREGSRNGMAGCHGEQRLGLSGMGRGDPCKSRVSAKKEGEKGGGTGPGSPRRGHAPS